jgi:hypothetical protein
MYLNCSNIYKVLFFSILVIIVFGFFSLLFANANKSNTYNAAGIKLSVLNMPLAQASSIADIEDGASEGMVPISKALRLDANKNIIEDIYSGVGERDSNYVSLLNNQYVRVTFESLLDSTRDITIFGRPTNNDNESIIEAYSIDGIKVGTFSIDHDGKYTLVLSKLTSPSDTFDLKILGNVDIDYITDPNAYWVGGTGDWSDSSHWASTSNGVGGSFGGVPSETTNVFFNSFSGDASKIITINTPATVAKASIYPRRRLPESPRKIDAG